MSNVFEDARAQMIEARQRFADEHGVPLCRVSVGWESGSGWVFKVLPVVPESDA